MSFDVGDLEPGTLYHYRLLAASSSGETVSSGAICTTPRAGARLRIDARQASPRDSRCVMTLRGSIRTRGALARSAGGTVRAAFTVDLPEGRTRRSARARVAAGSWKISLMAPLVEIDPRPPRSRITVRYSGDGALRPARTTRRIRLGAACAAPIRFLG